ncbi:hypothetical protein BD410DRAFT_810650 [Rickenella mellea]|uniref:Uncharacterized protein n=1 Tax=Rickenella mellea TaxID=50990 RepID=A0A4Y7PDI1_9AGAM|nr:hypothetical protein BD410DRAFT_810650 [Rickenella mellea]
MYLVVLKRSVGTCKSKFNYYQSLRSTLPSAYISVHVSGRSGCSAPDDAPSTNLPTDHLGGEMVTRYQSEVGWVQVVRVATVDISESDEIAIHLGVLVLHLTCILYLSPTKVDYGMW